MNVLVRAYADEWFSHYNYYVAAHMMRGPEAESVGTFLRDKSSSAFHRADMLANRIGELRGKLIPKLTDLLL
jgi:ferritin-like protein